MKRFHVHVSVANLDQSIGFYSALFAAPPTVLQPDYAKWMLESPRINFAISTHRQPVGVNHFGIQVDSDDELRGMHATLQDADAKLVEENNQACCDREQPTPDGVCCIAKSHNDLTGACCTALQVNPG